MTTIEARYRDSTAPVEERTADLLVRMTRTEKLAQLGSAWAFEFVDEGGLRPDRLASLAPDGLGELTRLAGSTNLPPVQVAKVANEIQRFFVEETRLGIPVLVHEECLHGLLAWGAPCFQQSIGAAASFDPHLVTAMAVTIRRRMLATGGRHALGPVLDLARDPRWGRIEETYGEDPYLAAAMGIAYVRGLQGPDLTAGVAATGKHLVGHGLAEGGLNQAPVHVGPRELRNEQLYPFEAAVREAGLVSVMPAYCDVDGMPCHASRELLTQILRDEWGFDGVVASDYVAVSMLATQHRLTADLSMAAMLALEAGVDLELPATVAYGTPLDRALLEGRLDECRLDEAVGRVLRLKFRLGLFDRPYVDAPTDAGLEILAVEERQVGLELARRSMVLVKNDGLLPLAPGVRRVAVIGPIADSARDLLGDYSHLLHMETLREMQAQDGAFGVGTDARTLAPGDELSQRETILDALAARLTSADVRYARGTGVRTGDDADISEAVAVAAWAEVTVMVLGERSGLTDDATTGEFRDRLELGFSGRQQELLEAVVETGTPVALVVVSGRPLSIPWAATRCGSILLAWVPGDFGPYAVADVLTGATSPGGKLPVTVPRHVGQVPRTYRHHPTGGRSNPKGDYVDGPAAPLWPFGFGLTYTSFRLSDLRLDRTTMLTDGGEVTISVDVVNVGDRAGDEVVQLYVRDEEATVARPSRELAGFCRVTLDPGQRRTVAFALSSEQLAYVGADLRRVVEAGLVRIMVGTSSTDIPMTAELNVRGPTIRLGDRRRYLTKATVH